jgi:SprT protein
MPLPVGKHRGIFIMNTSETIQLLDQYTTEIERVIEKASVMFNIPALKATKIRYNIKGQCAGQAIREHSGKTILRFNIEAIEKDWAGMYNDTIPHEVAHLVCYLRPDLGKNHNKGWKRVCEALGGKSDRCHTIDLTPARKVQRVRYIYQVEDGSKIKVTKTVHNRIDASPGSYFIRPSRTYSGKKMDLHPRHFVESIEI